MSFSAPETVRAAFEISLLIDPDTGLLGLEFSPGRTRADLAARILEHTERFIQGAVSDPFAPVETFDILPEAERFQLVLGFNSRAVELPDTTIPATIQEQARKTPDRIAVECGDERLTYRELNGRANRVAAKVRATVPRQSIVAVIMDRSPVMAAVILGIWKAGCAYLPLDPRAPEARNREVLRSAEPALIICSGASPDWPSALGTDTLLLVLDSEGISGGTLLHHEDSPSDVPLDITGDELAYVIYTSGSTGRPKGAMIEHRGMLNHMLAKIDDLQLGSDSVVAQTASQCFDISVWQFFAALCTGGKTIIYPHEQVVDVDRFLDDVAPKVSVLELVPSYFQLMVASLERRPRRMAAMRMLILNAEVLSRSLVERWFSLYPDIPVINAYGATETSDDVTHHLLTAPPIPDNIPIGRPLQNCYLYVVDRLMRPCPVGVKGELLIAGISVGRGYLNDPERTDASFGRDPLRPERGRMYRTGDICRWRPEGSLEFFGRSDYQVKIRGFRVELEEIDKAVMAHPAIQYAAVVQEAAEDPQLYCHYVSQKPLTVGSLREHLAGLLPDYMIPAYYVQWAELPLTENGKVDRHALTASVPDASAGQEALHIVPAVRPRTELEARLQQAWVKVLGQREVGVTDNFFELGGDSMKAIRLAADFGGRLIALDIFNHPTIESLAKHLTGAQEERRLLRLLTSETSDPQLSVVGIPNSAGDPASFARTAAALTALNPRCRLYSLAPPREPLSEGLTANALLERLVGAVVAEIQDGIDGSLFLFGQCNGSAQALAIAERLQQEGRELVGVGVSGILPRVKIEYEEDLFRNRWSANEIMSFLEELGATLPEDPEDVALFLRDFRYDAGLANAYFNETNRRIRTESFDRLRAPLFCFMGDRDPLVAGYEKRLSAWYRNVEHVRVSVFYDLGHYLLRDQPEQLAAVLDEVACGRMPGSEVQRPGVVARLLQH